MNVILENLSSILIILAVLCMTVSIITQLIKDVGILSKIPTALVVIILSIIICVTAYSFYCLYFAIPIVLYYYIACIFAGFFVAFICMYGWDNLLELWKRFYKNKSDLDDLIK